MLNILNWYQYIYKGVFFFIQYFGYSGSFVGFFNDIVILRIQSFFVFFDIVQVVNFFFNRYYNYDFYECYIIGWGKIRGN